MSKKILALIPVACFAIFLAGCGSKTPSTVPDGSADGTDSSTGESNSRTTNAAKDVKSKINVGDGSAIDVNYREDGSSVGAKWPSSMPNTVPVFKYGLIDVVLTYEETGTWSVQFVNLQSDVAEKYKQDLAAAGWQIDPEYPGGISATKGEFSLSFDLGIIGEGSGQLLVFKNNS